jgi:hypothetical protein
VVLVFELGSRLMSPYNYVFKIMEQSKYTPVHCICIDENIIELMGFYCSAHFTLLFIL